MKFLRSVVFVLLLFSLGSAHSQTPQGVFPGTNPPGGFTDFSVTLDQSVTNVAFVLPGTASAYSYLLVKKGNPPNDNDFDFISAQDGKTNSVNIELPDTGAGTYHVRVKTPSSSVTHGFSLEVTSNRPDMRSAAYPVSKRITSQSTGFMAPGTFQYFRVDVSSAIEGLRFRLDSLNNSVPDIYVQRGALPTAGSFLKRSVNQTNDVIVFGSTELSPGTYFIGVNFPSGFSGNGNFTLNTEILNIKTLQWDTGITDLGTQGLSYTNTLKDDYYFRITTQNPSLGAWRTALNVTSGEADLYLMKGAPPTTLENQFKSTRLGSDGLILTPSQPAQFAAAEDWYLMVRSSEGARWNLVSGAPYVADLGTLRTDALSGSGDVVIGGEGMRFFKTTVPATALAWRLWLNGGTNQILIKKASVPVLTSFDLGQTNNMLVVPSDLVSGQLYFIGIPGLPGQTINLDSRQQAIIDLPFNSTTSATNDGFPYITYRVQVPGNQVAWQMNLGVNAGNPNLAVRRNLVPNENRNDAYSEVPGQVADSITLVPDGLSDGTFFITVYSTTTNAFQLQNGTPTITSLNFTDSVTNDETNRVGWRFYRVLDINQQLGTLGWDLSLSNASSGTKIALRRNKAPGIWTSRGGSFSGNFTDLLSNGDFLQIPGHQADVWYIGIYNPTNLLGNFRLDIKELTAQLLSGDNAQLSRSGSPSGKWQFFKVVVPADILGWDLRLVDVTAGLPRLVIRRDALPVNMNSTLSSPATATSWLSGSQWAPSSDWTRRTTSSDGQVIEDGRIAAMGMFHPLEPGTYYVGVMNNTGTNVMSYNLLSRWIGVGRSIPVREMAFQSGMTTNLSLAPREAAYYRVDVPPNVPSWKLKLTPTLGEVMMVVGTNGIPNIESEKRVQKTGKEHYLQLPAANATTAFLRPGPNYIAVVGEGINPPSPSRIGLDNSSFVLESRGAMTEHEFGVLGIEDLVINGQLEGGEIAAYHFSNLGNTLGFEITLEDRTGNPVAVSRLGADLADPGAGSSLASGDNYGYEGGKASTVASTFKITVGDPGARETIMVMARKLSTDWPDATYTLRLKKILPDPVTFDDGSAVVTNQVAEGWKFFRVDVPANALGWDLRLIDVTGSPQLSIGREFLPVTSSTALVNPSGGTNWPVSGVWLAGRDWTERSQGINGVSEDSRILAMGMGRPLEPGTYYIGVRARVGTTAPVSYKLLSRGIGTGKSIPIQDLTFNGGSVSGDALAPREAAYFKVEVPTNAQSWKIKLTANSGEVMLAGVKDALPNVLVTPSSPWSSGASQGRKLQKIGDEFFLILPPVGRTNIVGGIYYLAVVGEGRSPINTSTIGAGSSAYTLQSLGEIPVLELGTVTASGISQTASLAPEEVVAFRFQLPPGVLSLEARLTNRVGNPVMVLRPGTSFPDPGASSASVPSDPYGSEGGEPALFAHPDFINSSSPTSGVYTLMVKARPLNGVYTNASFNLAINAVLSTPTLSFDGGDISVANHPAGVWRSYRIEVPTNALGWDVRLVNVSNGLPRMVIRRDGVLSTFSTSPWSSPGSLPNWPTLNQWAAAGDWTRRPTSPDGSINEDGRILAMSMGRPLEPGVYYVGVINTSGNDPMAYRLLSRGIGADLSIPVQDLPYEGALTNQSLGVREAAYYRVIVPSNSVSWKVKLTSLSGEVMMVGMRDKIPNVDSIAGSGSLSVGKGMQKPGNEHFVLLPGNGQALIPPGTNYLAVIGEGLNPARSTSVGVGNSSYVLESEGTLEVQDIGIVSEDDLIVADQLEGGETKAYQFTVLPGLLGVEIRLEDRIGTPVMFLRAGSGLPDPGGNFPGGSPDPYGNEGGYTSTSQHPSSITLPNAVPSVYSLVIKARQLQSFGYPDASYLIRVRQILTPTINFDGGQNTNGLSNSVSDLLESNQRAFYKVELPATNNGAPVLGWKLALSQSSGVAFVRARKDQLPEDSGSTTMPFVAGEAILVPPYLTKGTWYVEVLGSNSTAFTLTSRPLELERPAWVMPAVGGLSSTPGLTHPDFGDTGFDTNGLALPGDQSVALDQGYSHYYGILVPTQNVGLVRVQLDAISGNPDLYLRQGRAPTLHHGAQGTAGSVFDRSMVANGTEYASWVPVDGKKETALAPGFWYMAVRSGNANARYRLRVSTGNIRTISQVPAEGLSLPNQLLANGDWRYYAMRVPENVPFPVTFGFTLQSGTVRLHVRDTVPPGIGTSSADFRDWTTDLKNGNGSIYPNYGPGSYTVNTPPLRPGAIYYFGFRASVNDATFTLNIFTNGDSGIQLPKIDFYNGSVNLSLAPNAEVTYRIDVPTEATRWKSFSIHSAGVAVFIEQGTLPNKTSVHFRSGGADTSINQYLLSTWPWVPNQFYYMTVSNTTTVAQNFSWTMNGLNLFTDDSDNDSLPDAWENQYFGNLSNGPNNDSDGDGVSNFFELQQGTNPANSRSYLAKLTVSAGVNGTVHRNPDLTNYVLGTTVTLTAVPDAGYSFLGWSGQATGTNSTLSVLMDTNKTILARIKITGDNFSTALPLLPGRIQTARNVTASKEAGEPEHAENPAIKSMWWVWTANAPGIVSISTLGSTFDTVMAVYKGSSVSNLTTVVGNDNENTSATHSKVTFTAQAGTTYYVAVDGFIGSSGNIQIVLEASLDDTDGDGLSDAWEQLYFKNLAQGPAGDFDGDGFSNLTEFQQGTNPVKVPGDDFSTATSITLGQSASAINTLATKETGEPGHAGSTAAKSMWWKWVAPSSEAYEVSTEGSSFDTVLGVYLGGSVAALTEVASNHNSGTSSFSKAEFTAVSGVTYYIAVDGAGGLSGTIQLRISAHTVATRPLKISVADFDTSGMFSLRIQTNPGFSYDIDVSADLKTWVTLTNISSTSEFIEFKEANPIGFSRYYRVRQR